MDYTEGFDLVLSTSEWFSHGQTLDNKKPLNAKQ